MAIKGQHLAPIAEGHQIYADRLEVMGLHRQKLAAIQFIKGREQRIEFEREPENQYDKNAIKVFGCWKGWFLKRREFLGYVPREVAKVVADLDVFESIEPRLARTYLKDDGFVDIFYQFTGPKERAHEFKAALEE